MRKSNTAFATKQTPDNTPSQAGFAAILVTLIVVGLITLMTVGFLQVVSREGRDSLDRQLSTQAFYAAETAVNDAQQLMRRGDLTTAKTDCDVSGSDWNPELSAGIEYTCVLTEMDLEELHYQNIGTDRARGIRLNAVDTGGSATDIGEVNLAWRTNPKPSISNSGEAGVGFPPAGAESGFGPHGLAPVLRVTITPLSGPNALHRQSLVENTYTTFLRPTDNWLDDSADYEAGADNVANQGTIQQVDCDSGDMWCNFTIEGLNFTNALLTVRAIYGEAELLITPKNNGIRFRGEQVMIDATGRAGDVLRRIQVRLSDDGGAQIPSFAIEAAAGICKDYQIGASTSSTECSIN